MSVGKCVLLSVGVLARACVCVCVTSLLEKNNLCVNAILHSRVILNNEGKV